MVSLTKEIQSELFSAAKQVLASGVSASMRFNTYLGQPLYTARGDGAYLYGVDGKRYIDLNLSNGATMLGHNHPQVKRAVTEGLRAGVICSSETPYHEKLAAQLVEIIPAAERVRFSTVGSEATLVALRISRAATGRTKFLKFDGHFHGLTEPWLHHHERPGDPDSTIVPSSKGVPSSMSSDVVMTAWNDADAFERVIARHGEQLAAVFCEPVHFNAGCIPPAEGFLQLLRDRTVEHGIVLVFDEVLSGFRTHLGGAQAQYGITPDLTTHAKALANGFPLSSVSGKAELMNERAPAGGVADSGTYSGHHLSVLAAIATLEELREPGLYDRLNRTADAFYADLQAIFDRSGVPARVQGMGARFGIYFGLTHPVNTWSDALSHDHHLNRLFVTGLFEHRVYIHGFSRQGPPGHAGFSTAHTPKDFADVLTAVEDVVKGMTKVA